MLIKTPLQGANISDTRYTAHSNQAALIAG